MANIFINKSSFYQGDNVCNIAIVHRTHSNHTIWKKSKVIEKYSNKVNKLITRPSYISVQIPTDRQTQSYALITYLAYLKLQSALPSFDARLLFYSPWGQEHVWREPKSKYNFFDTLPYVENKKKRSPSLESP